MAAQPAPYVFKEPDLSNAAINLIGCHRCHRCVTGNKLDLTIFLHLKYLLPIYILRFSYTSIVSM